VVKVNRRFQLLDEVYQHIAIVITNNKMSDFGPILKGQDFNDDDTISRGNFF